MASSSRWAEMSEDIAQIADKVGQSVVAVQPGQTHAASAVIWQEGIIVTAHHSAPGDEVSVILPAGKSTVAHKKGRDPSTDLAIFSMEKGEGTAAPHGDASQLRVGHLVLALARTRRGNLTASSGIISGLMEAWHTWEGAQIDRFVRTIPASTVSRVVDELLAKGHVERPYLGVALQPVSLPEDMKTKLNIGSHYGLLLVHVESNGPAATAGLMLGDIVVEIGGKSLPRTHDLRMVLANERVGERITVGIVRSGERRETWVTLGDRFGR
jgi:serine protease Do